MPNTISTLLLLIVPLSLVAPTRADESLVAHWPLVTDGRDISGNKLHATAHEIDFTVAGPSKRIPAAAGFDGRTSRLEVSDHELLHFGDSDFTIAAWVYTDETTDDIPGDILSKYDLQTHRGFHVAIKTNAGVTFSQPNFRQLQFGIDDDRAAENWNDCGRLGNALLAFALCSFDGQLYAGTCEPGRDESGHVYRYAGDQKWIDCGSPDKSNAVTALAVFDGRMYAATGKYRVAGSALPESENRTPGGRVFRYDPPSGWIDCGGPRRTDLSPSHKTPNTEAIGGLAVFQGNLYATSLYHPPGFFRYEGNQTWKKCELPARPNDLPGESKAMRVGAIAAFNGALYGSSYDGGRVFRFDGKRWEDCGQLGENTQTYSFAVYAGQLYVGTWPSGRAYRLHQPGTVPFCGGHHRGDGRGAKGDCPPQSQIPLQWQDCGRLGDELEVMGMLVHNGRLIAGTLPLAEVYLYDGDNIWQKLARLDHTPDVRYRRAWCMAEHAGQVFCSTLPSGRIYSWRAGRIAMANHAFPAGWHHIAAIRAGKSLKILVNGQQVAEETGFQPADFNLSNDQPFQIGFGPNDFFQGRMYDVRLYRRAMTSDEIATLENATLTPEPDPILPQ